MACVAARGDSHNAPIHRVHVVAQWFDEHDTDVIHMSWPSHSPDLNPIEHLWNILERCLRRHFPPPSNRCELIDFLVKEWCFKPQAEFQMLVDSMPQRIQVVLAARGGPTPYSVTFHWCFHYLYDLLYPKMTPIPCTPFFQVIVTTIAPPPSHSTLFVW